MLHAMILSSQVSPSLVKENLSWDKLIMVNVVIAHPLILVSSWYCHYTGRPGQVKPTKSIFSTSYCRT